jgi:DNA-directed RNA polymerase subunit RPC12/RpoP
MKSIIKPCAVCGQNFESIRKRITCPNCRRKYLVPTRKGYADALEIKLARKERALQNYLSKGGE